MFRYVFPKKEEFLNLFIASLVLSMMFSASILSQQARFIELFIPTLGFLLILLLLRLIVIKLYAYYDGFEINMYLNNFNRFGIKPYHKLSYYSDISLNKNLVSGFRSIPTYIISIMLYILSATLIIYPGFWSYTYRIIPFRFSGSKKKYEKMPFVMTSFYRYTLALFSGFLFLWLVLMILNYLGLGGVYYLFVVLWLAFALLIPIPGNEGFDLFLKNKFLWSAALTLFGISLLLIFVIKSFIIYILLLILSLTVALFSYLWRKLV